MLQRIKSKFFDWLIKPERKRFQSDMHKAMTNQLVYGRSFVKNRDYSLPRQIWRRLLGKRIMPERVRPQDIDDEKHEITRTRYIEID